MDRAKSIARSWDHNAVNWTRAVREGRIASRKAGTDTAIVQAILRRRPKRLLDVGCGEGWLVRCIAELTGCTAVGIDGSAALIEAASAADPANDYRIARYDALCAGDALRGSLVAGSFDVIAFNYALFDEEAVALLAALRPLLAADGAVVIQTLHPAAVAEGERDGWRSEDFAAFEGEGWQPMPWFFRTLDSWHEVVREAGFDLLEQHEPVAEPGGPPLSLLMICGPARP